MEERDALAAGLGELDRKVDRGARLGEKSTGHKTWWNGRSSPSVRMVIPFGTGKADAIRARSGLARVSYHASVIPEVERGIVLVVDDNAENRALAKAALEDEDIPVVLAVNGEQAIAAFTSAPPICVLLDIRMPGMDGIAVCERLRALPGGERCAIIFVTAQRDVETFDRALRAGGDDFMTKPFRPAELVVRIQTAMRLRQVATERAELAVALKRQRDELLRLQLHKEQMSAFLVHDLKNPVNTIALHVQRILRHANADERSRDAAQKIQDETRGLLRMITNLLDIGKADEGQLAPARTAVDASALLAAAVDDLRSSAAAHEVALTTRIEPVQLHVDRDLMHRVLCNLTENALRYAPSGSSVELSARPSGDGAELRVTDAGPGIAASERARVFERFVTCESGQRANRGLGLAFCKVAVEAHGGRIWIEDAAPRRRVLHLGRRRGLTAAWSRRYHRALHDLRSSRVSLSEPEPRDQRDARRREFSAMTITSGADRARTRSADGSNQVARCLLYRRA
jgi:signal transduction histidine kinase